ncbi:MAG: hypothetical protein V4508_15880 [Pseudomonadota bacterium]
MLSDARKAVISGLPTNGSGAPTFSRASSARTVNLHPAVESKLGLLDTPMRLAFEKTGALAVWRSAFRMLEKTAGAALNNKVGEVINAGMIDRYGLFDAVTLYAIRRKLGVMMFPPSVASM